MANLKEILRKNKNNINKNKVKFNLFGEEIEQVIHWNNLSVMIVDELYEGDFDAFTAVLERIQAVAESHNKGTNDNTSLGFPGIIKANLAIIWGLFAGAGVVLTYDEAQEITHAISKDQKALQMCWTTMIAGDIDPSDIELINNKNENEKPENKKKE